MTTSFQYARDHGYELDYGHGYLAIAHAVEHILMLNPSDAVDRRKHVSRFLVPYDRYLQVVSHLRSAGATAESKAAWATRQGVDVGEVARLQAESGSLIYVPMGQGELEDPVKSHRVDASCALRYGDCGVRPAGPSANGYYLEWDICLDILIRSQTAEHSDGNAYDNPGIYTPYRGMLVDAILSRFLAYPVLDPVTPRYNRTLDSATAWDWDSRWETIAEADPSVIVDSWEAADPDEGDDALQWYNGWTDAEKRLWRDTTQVPQLIVVGVGDDTDINYWMSLYASGLSDSLKGYWPTTVKIRVREHRAMPVASMGWTAGV